MARRTVAKTDNDVDAAILEVSRLRAALIAVAENRNALSGQRGWVDIGVF
jgi:hypothetical protein